MSGLWTVLVKRGDSQVMRVGPFGHDSARAFVQEHVVPDAGLTADMEQMITPSIAVEVLTGVERRCCAGPDELGRHYLNCVQRCQDCKGDPDGPNRCRCAGPFGRCQQCGSVEPLTPYVVTAGAEQVMVLPLHADATAADSAPEPTRCPGSLTMSHEPPDVVITRPGGVLLRLGSTDHGANLGEPC